MGVKRRSASSLSAAVTVKTVKMDGHFRGSFPCSLKSLVETLMEKLDLDGDTVGS